MKATLVLVLLTTCTMGDCPTEWCQDRPDINGSPVSDPEGDAGEQG